MGERDASTEAADAGVLNGRSHGATPEVVTISDDDEDVILQVWLLPNCGLAFLL